MSANFAYVQTTGIVQGASSQAFGANNTEGNCVIVFDFTRSTSITDTQGNYYTRLVESWSASNYAIWVAVNISGGANAIRGNNGAALVGVEYSSVATPYYVCPGHIECGQGVDGQQTITSANSGNTSTNPGTNYTSGSEVMVVFGAQAGSQQGIPGFIAGFVPPSDMPSWSVPSGTTERWNGPAVPFGGNGVYIPFALVGDQDVADISSTYSATPLQFTDNHGTGSPSVSACVFLNLTGACAGGVSSADAPVPPGRDGTGQPDSSVGSTGTSLVDTQGGPLLVYHEQEDRWFYHRNGIGLQRFHGFLFDGIQMLALTGTTPSGGSSDAVAFNVDDFRGFLTQDEPVTGSSGNNIECVFQTHFEDVALPDNEKMWIEIVVDYILNTTDTFTVQIGFNNFAPATVGTLTSSAGLRKSVSFTIGTDGTLARNISVLIYGSLSAAAEIHNVYLYYYPEARRALAASTIPIDLGSPQVKECKELMLDIDASAGTVDVNVYSDLPGNQLALRNPPSPIAVSNTGRAIMKYPFARIEGYLWRLALTAQTTPAGTFRLYSARLLMRPIGVYIEAYESAAGFVWDSQSLTFESGLTHIPRAYAIALSALPIKRFREISLDIDTFGGDVTLTFLTDLPGLQDTARCTFTVNTGSNGRRYVRLPLPLGIGAAAYNAGTTYGAGAFVSYAGNSWQSLQAANSGHTPAVGSTWWQPLPIEGRKCRLQFSGSSKYVLYDAAVEVLAIGVYIEAYEASGGAVYDSRELDFGSQKPKEARELELDIETTGAVTATLYCDLPGYSMAQCFQNTGISTTGRQKILLPLTEDSAPYDYPIGRLFRLVISGTNAWRLYGATLKLREFGTYLTGDEASANPIGVWDSTPLDLGTERLKEFKKLEVEIQTDAAGTATLKLWTDQPAGALTPQFTTTINTGGGRQSVKIPMPNGIRGRLLQVEVSGCGARLFNGRVWWRPFNEPKAQWDWAPLPIEPTPPQWTNAPFPVNPTEAQWFWAKVLPITETPNEWTWVDVPFEVTGP